MNNPATLNEVTLLQIFLRSCVPNSLLLEIADRLVAEKSTKVFAKEVSAMTRRPNGMFWNGVI